jgi:hypothetical protein
MKTLDQMIVELTALRDKVGGNVQVFFDKNGCDEGPRSITEIKETGYFTDVDGFYWVDDYSPTDSHKVYPLIRIYSDRSSLFDNLENK